MMAAFSEAPAATRFKIPLIVASSAFACATRFCQVSVVTRDFTRIRSGFVGSSTQTVDHAQISKSTKKIVSSPEISHRLVTLFPGWPNSLSEADFEAWFL
jgi:hypothetical protein